MKKTMSLSSVIALLFLSGFSAGCSKDEPPSCSEAVGHFYDQSCLLLINGVEQTRGEAIAGCEYNRPLYNSCGCESQFNDWLSCFDGIGLLQCSNCDGVMSTASACMAACP